MTAVVRPSGRRFDALRDIRIETGFTRHAEGSVLISVGDTRVLCNATVENRVPGFLRGKGEGWVTAEYSMLPRATKERTQREASAGRIGGRTHEIQRDAVRQERAAGLARRALQLDVDGVVRQAFVAVATGDLRRQHRADRAVQVLHRRDELHLLAVLQRRAGLLD